MSNSSLAEKFIKATHYSSGRSGRSIEKIAIHHMAGVLSTEQCGSIFQGNRQASAHYGIGNDGRIAQYVDEANTAWTNSHWDSNCKSVTIETSNSEIGGNWTVSDVALNSLIRLVADIAKRNNLVLEKGKTVVWHSMYVATTCPGPYLLSKIDYIIEEANKINNTQNSTENATENSTEQAINSYLVKVTANCLNIRDGVGTNYKINGQITDKGTYTIVETQGNWGRLKSGAGWICLDYTTKNVTITRYKINANGGLWLLDGNGKKIKAYINGDEVEYIGEGYTKYGYKYVKVKASDGKVGYMAKSYLV